MLLHLIIGLADFFAGIVTIISCQSLLTTDECLNGGILYVGTCICPEDTWGPRCEFINRGVCSSFPCLNGGWCLSFDGEEYVCQCPEAFTGSQCETEDICAQVECNGGACVAQNGVAICECPPGLIGLNCEVEMNTCDVNPCLNEGICLVVNEFPMCFCQKHFWGILCEFKIDPCSSSPCGDHGQCIAIGDKFQCNCEEGFRGDYCQLKDLCFGDPCLNGGTCIENGQEAFCNCVEPFSGVVCEIYEVVIRPSPCSSEYCMNGGECRSDDEGDECVCAPGYFGTQCEDTFCSSFQCFNGGVCINSDTPECRCPEPFLGTHCEYQIVVDVDPCLGQPCLNGGSCYSSTNNYTCACEDHYEGLRCEKRQEIPTESVTPMTCFHPPCSVFPSLPPTEVHETDRSPKLETRPPHKLETRPPHIRIDEILQDDDSVGLLNVEFYGEEFEQPELAANPENTDIIVYVNNTLDKSQENRHQDVHIYSPCSSDPCWNEGQCLSIGTSFTCVCSHNTTGPLCEVTLGPCYFQTCTYHGVCLPVNGDPYCVCHIGYTGQFCTYQIEEVEEGEVHGERIESYPEADLIEIESEQFVDEFWYIVIAGASVVTIFAAMIAPCVYAKRSQEDEIKMKDIPTGFDRMHSNFEPPLADTITQHEPNDSTSRKVSSTGKKPLSNEEEERLWLAKQIQSRRDRVDGFLLSDNEDEVISK